MWCKIMIVEDDMNYRFAIKETIPWEEHGYQIAAEAIHGKQALQMLSNHQIDIVLTDMSMPLMNGVELTKEITKQYPDIIIVALSAYDDFQFVKESLKWGAKDYILKQNMEGMEIIKIIDDLREEKEKKENRHFNHQRNQMEIRQCLIEQKQLTEENIGYLKSRLMGRGMFALLISTGESLHDFLKKNEFLEEDYVLKWMEMPEGILSFPYLPKENSFLLQMTRMNEIMANLRQKLDKKYVIAAGNFVFSPEHMIKTAVQAKQAMLYSYYTEKKDVFYAYELEQEEKKRVQNYLITEIEDEWFEDGNNIKDRLDFICETLTEKKPDVDVLDKNFMNFYLKFLQTAIGRYDEWESVSYFEELKKRNSLIKKKEFTLQRILMLWEQKRNSYTGKSQEIRKALDYIQKNYKEEITLTGLAGYVGLSDNYFSNLFKAEVGKTLTRYINELRVEKAKYLMEHTTLKVYEIAQEVGYKNATYFSTIFKKITDMAVTDYKKN